MGWSPDGTRLLPRRDPGALRSCASPSIQSPATITSDGVVLVTPMPSRIGFPDGLAVDTRGHLWVAEFAGSAVHEFSPEGTAFAPSPSRPLQTTSCAFVGPDLDELWVTSAAWQIDPADDADAGSIFRVEGLGAVGVPRRRSGADVPITLDLRRARGDDHARARRRHRADRRPRDRRRRFFAQSPTGLVGPGADRRPTPWPGGCAAIPAAGSCSCPTPGPSASTTALAGLPRRSRARRHGWCSRRMRHPASSRPTCSPRRCACAVRCRLGRHPDGHRRDREPLPRPRARRASCSIPHSERRSSTMRATSSRRDRRDRRRGARAASPPPIVVGTPREVLPAGPVARAASGCPVPAAGSSLFAALTDFADARGHLLQPDARTRPCASPGTARVLPHAWFWIEANAGPRLALVPAPLRGRRRAGERAPRRGRQIPAHPRGGPGTRLAGSAVAPVHHLAHQTRDLAPDVIDPHTGTT